MKRRRMPPSLRRRRRTPAVRETDPQPVPAKVVKSIKHASCWIKGVIALLAIASAVLFFTPLTGVAALLSIIDIIIVIVLNLWYRYIG